EFAAGTPFVPPVPFWHALRPRDERSSAVLRAFTDEQAADLLRTAVRALAERQAQVSAAKAADEAAGEHGADSGAATGSAGANRPVVPTADEVVRRIVTRALPGLTDKRLLVGVTALVRTTVQIADAVARFVTPPVEQPKPQRKRTEGMFADYRPEHGDDRTLRAAADGLARMWGSWGGESQWTALRQIREVNHVLLGKPADGMRLSERTRRSPLGDGWHSDEHTVPRMGMTWPELLGVLRPLAYRATVPTLPAAEREALLLLFEALAEGPLAAPGDGIREIVLGEPYDKHRQRERAGQVLRREGRTVVVLGCQNVDMARDRVNWLALDHDPAGVFGAVAHFTLEKETRHAPALPAGALPAVARLTRDKGAPPWQPEAPGDLAAATGDGVGPLQATVLLAAQPERLDAGALATTGLKPRQLDAGNRMLNSLLATDRAALIGALLPDDPAELWTAGPDTGALGRVWSERLGALVRLPEDLAVTLDGLPVGSAEAVLNPERTPWLSRTTVQRPDKNGRLVAEDPAAVPHRYTLTGAVDALASLAYALPHGHPLRAALPEGLAAVRRRLADPGLLLDLDVEWTEKGGTTAAELRKAYGLPATGGADAEGTTRIGAALVLR
ncbi:hypothetical protein ACN6LL_002150, partial [Streptomyces violaceoruber]